MEAVDGDIKATSLCTSMVIAVAVVTVVAFKTLLAVTGSGGWDTVVRVESTALNSAGLEGKKA